MATHLPTWRRRRWNPPNPIFPPPGKPHDPSPGAGTSLGYAAELDLTVQGDAAGADQLLRVIESARRIEHVSHHLLAAVACGRGAEVGDQTVSPTRVAVVPGIVARQAEEDMGRWLELERSTRCPDVLVVVLLTGRDVLAETGVA